MRAKAWLRIAAVAALALPLIPLQWLAVRRGWPLAARLPVLFHRLVLKTIGVRIIEEGAIDARRPLLVAANHVSWLDIPVIGSLAPLSFVAKSEVAGWPVIGLFARLQRSVFVERARRRQTGAATAAIGHRLKAGDAIVLFAEGTTGDGIRILPFRSALIGAAREALGPSTETAFVQPMAIRYVARDGLPIGRGGMAAIAWTGDEDLAPHLMGILAGGPIDVRVRWGEAVPVAQDSDRKLLTKALETEVRALSLDR